MLYCGAMEKVEIKFHIWPDQISAALAWSGEERPKCESCNLKQRVGVSIPGVKEGCYGAQRGRRCFYTTYALVIELLEGEEAVEAKKRLSELIRQRALCVQKKKLVEGAMNVRTLERQLVVAQASRKFTRG